MGAESGGGGGEVGGRGGEREVTENKDTACTHTMHQTTDTVWLALFLLDSRSVIPS